MAVKIVVRDIAHSHPDGMISSTDLYYANVGNLLLRKASRVSSSKTLLNSELRAIAVRIALYFEDIICDGGLWRSFVNKHQELYGKLLPFYDVEEEYYHDEPHVEDIRLLIWDTMLSENPDDIIHPEEDVIIHLADAFYDVLENEFENAPINESMKQFYEEASFMDDFIKMRNMLMWLYSSCYLTNHSLNKEFLLEEMESVCRLLNLDENDPRAIYASTSQVFFKGKIGMLALLPVEWLAMLMEVNGNDQHAETLRALEFRNYDLYVIEDFDDETVKYKDLDDNIYSVRLDGYQDLTPEDLIEVEGCVGSFVKYSGEWQPNGMNSWGKFRKAFQEQKKNRKRYKEGFSEKNYKKLMKQTNGSPFVYLRDGKEVRQFMMEGIGVPENLIQPSELDNQEEVVAWVPTNEEGPFFSFGCTYAICDPRNPFYVEDETGEDSLELITNPELSESSMAHYLIEHNMLPYASFDHSKGKERGRQLVQDNLDFIARCFRRGYY